MRQHKGRCAVVERALGYGLNEREQRSGNGSGDSGLFDPCQAVTRAHDEGVGKPVRQPDARSKVAFLQIARGTRIAVLAQQVELLGVQVEHCAAVVRFS